MVARKANSDNLLFGFPLPPLPADLPLPPLPPIHDRILYERATTHTSLYAVRRITHDFDTANYVQINDYEKMEYLGDRLLGVCADIVVDEMYPNMRQGVATMVHDRLVCNDTLAQLADRYGITAQIKTSADAQHIKQHIVKIRGSAFEAWVAGVYYDWLLLCGGPPPAGASHAIPQPITEPTELGAKPMSPPTKPQPGTDANDTDDPPSESSLHLRSLFPSGPASPVWPDSCPSASPARSHGGAIDYLLTWLRPMYLPILEFALTEMRKCQAQLEKDQPKPKPTKAPGKLPKENPDADFVREEERLSGGAVNALVLFANNQYSVEPVWSDKRSGPGMWRMTCELKLPDGRTFIRQADKPTKKLAKAMAALYVCRAVGIMKKGDGEVAASSGRPEGVAEKWSGKKRPQHS